MDMLEYNTLLFRTKDATLDPLAVSSTFCRGVSFRTTLTKSAADSQRAKLLIRLTFLLSCFSQWIT